MYNYIFVQLGQGKNNVHEYVSVQNCESGHEFEIMHKLKMLKAVGLVLRSVIFLMTDIIFLLITWADQT